MIPFEGGGVFRIRPIIKNLGLFFRPFLLPTFVLAYINIDLGKVQKYQRSFWTTNGLKGAKVDPGISDTLHR